MGSSSPHPSWKNRLPHVRHLHHPAAADEALFGVFVGAIMMLINFARLSLRKREPKTSIRENGEMRPPHV